MRGGVEGVGGVDKAHTHQYRLVRLGIERVERLERRQHLQGDGEST